MEYQSPRIKLLFPETVPRIFSILARKFTLDNVGKAFHFVHAFRTDAGEHFTKEFMEEDVSPESDKLNWCEILPQFATSTEIRENVFFHP